MKFDVEGARKAGYAETEIADFLAKGQKFDAAKAREAGYSDADIVQHLVSKQPKPTGSKTASMAISAINGLIDPIAGFEQLRLRAAEGVTSLGGLAPNPISRKIGQWRQAAEAEEVKRNVRVESSRENSGRDGLDIARIAGAVANPVNRIVPIGAGGSVIKAGAAQGAISGVLTPTQSEDFWLEKTGQTALGGVFGGAASKVADTAIRGAQGAMSRAKSAVTPIDITKVDQQINNAIAGQGFDLSSIPKTMLDAIRGQVAQGMASGKQTAPEAIANAVDFAALGIKGTKGQIARDPMQFSREFNLSQVQGAGEPLANLFNQQGRQLRESLGKVAPGIADPYETGNRLIKGFSQSDAQARDAINKLYSAARDSSGRYADVDHLAFVKQANDALDSQMLGRFLPTQARDLLNDVSAGNIPLNVNNLVQLDSVLSEAARGADKAGKTAIGKVREALRNAPIDSAAGVEAKTAFETASKAAAQRFAAIDKNPAMAAALDGIAPDQYLDRFVLRAPARDVRELIKTASPDDVQQIRVEVVDQLNQFLKKGQANYRNELARIGKNRLEALFSPDDVAQLNRIGRVARNIKEAPEGAVPNRSGTAAATMNMLQGLSGRIGAFPVINLGTQSFKMYSDDAFARAALNSNPLLNPARQAVPPNRLLIPLAGAVGSQTFQQ